MTLSNRIVVAAVSIAAFSGLARAGEVHVPQQFATIQAAIDASALSDIIFVAAGTYPEALTFLNKPDRAIIGVGKVVVDASGAADVVHLVNSPTIRLENLRLRGAADAGVNADVASTRLTLRKLTIEDIGDDGVVCAGDDALIDVVTVKNCADVGASIEGRSSFVRKLSVNAVGGRGIIVDGTRNVVTQCSVDGAGSDGILIVGNQSMNIVSQCTVKSSEGNSLWVASATTDNLVRNSSVQNAKSIAMRAHGAESVWLRNKANGAASIGMDCLGAVLTSGNIVHDTHGDAGYRIQSTSDTGLHAGNRVTKSAIDGFVIGSSALDNLLSRNKAKGSKSGFDLDDISAGANALIGNQFPTIGP